MSSHPGVPTIPPGSVFVCEYELDVIVDSFDESAYLHRADGTDEMRVTCAFRTKLGDSAPTADEPAVVARRLLESYIRGSWGFQGPEGMLTPGLVSAEELNALLASIQAEHDRHVVAAKSIDSRLVEVALEPGDLTDTMSKGDTGRQASSRDEPSPVQF